MQPNFTVSGTHRSPSNASMASTALVAVRFARMAAARSNACPPQLTARLKRMRMNMHTHVVSRRVYRPAVYSAAASDSEDVEAKRRRMADKLGSLVDNPIEQQFLLAALTGKEEVCAKCLQKHSPNTATRAGETVLMMSASQGHDSVVRLLLEQPGIEVNKSNALGLTALHVAATGNHTNCIEQLLEAGATASTLDRAGSSALTMLSRHLHRIVLEQLSEAGQDVSKPGSNPKAAAAFGRQWSASPAVQLLLTAAEKESIAKAAEAVVPPSPDAVQQQQERLAAAAANAEGMSRVLQHLLAVIEGQPQAAALRDKYGAELVRAVGADLVQQLLALLQQQQPEQLEQQLTALRSALLQGDGSKEGQAAAAPKWDPLSAAVQEMFQACSSAVDEQLAVMIKERPELLQQRQEAKDSAEQAAN